MRKIGLIIITILVAAVAVVAIDMNKKAEVKNSFKEENVYSFLQNEENRRDVYSSSIKLNRGSSANTCVYFIAEVLRKNNMVVPKDICNTSQIISFLDKKGWKKDNNYKNLVPGDICFTTDGFGNKKGIPTHTYVFMKWVKENNYDYAYICDNQAKDYKNQVYHIRNISVKAKTNGFNKDTFAFFMKNSP